MNEFYNQPQDSGFIPTPMPNREPETVQAEPIDNDPYISDKVWDFCQKLSHSMVLPKHLQATKDHDTTSDLYMIFGLGKSLGLNFFQSVYGIYCVPGGLPALYVRTKVALALQHGGIIESENFDEQTGIGTVTVIRNGRKFAGSFSVQDAINRGKLYVDPNGILQGYMTSNGRAGPWVTDWRSMIMTRARGRALDMAFADIFMGLSSLEDMTDFATARLPSNTAQSSTQLTQDAQKAVEPTEVKVLPEKPENSELQALIKPGKPGKKKAKIPEKMKVEDKPEQIQPMEMPLPDDAPLPDEPPSIGDDLPGVPF